MLLDLETKQPNRDRPLEVVGFQFLSAGSVTQITFLAGSVSAKGAITLTETLRPLRHRAGLSYHDITSAQSHWDVMS